MQTTLFDEHPELEVDSVSALEHISAKWGVSTGDIWELHNTRAQRRHFAVCGDARNPDVVAAAMQGKSGADMLHMDPPYGMGKESDGVTNDNLCYSKLAAFVGQVTEAASTRMSDKGAVYIWGKPELLWRIWYMGHLDVWPVRIFRNELVWAKGNCAGQASDTNRSYAPETERCLFFSLGHQGANNNSDNYWEGWDTYRLYLERAAATMGWGSANVRRITGTQNYSHWFTTSQFTIIPREHYNALARESNGAAFTLSYDEFAGGIERSKKEYREWRNAFCGFHDNTHSKMTDVFRQFQVTGEERWHHATPKPVEIVRDLIKTSAPVWGTVLVPFLGSGSDIVACELTNRLCSGIELQPEYIAVCLERGQRMGLEVTKIGSV